MSTPPRRSRRFRTRLGPDETEVYGDETSGATVRHSGEYVHVAADLYLPIWLEFSAVGLDSPDRFGRIELRDDRPEIVAMSWSSGPGQREIKQKDLRENLIPELLELYRLYTMRIAAEGDSETGERTIVLVPGQRAEMVSLRAPGHRVITDEFLASVADVYRRNIAHAPTQAVARTFGVKPRMASKYVDKARSAGLLPPTKQGQKKA
jgi:hypothetical protein